MGFRSTSRLSLLFLSFVVVMLVFPAMALAETVAADGTTSASMPTIQSDQVDYPPGATVTLTGSNWQPGEAVHIYVNDDQGNTWSRDADVSADASGNITDQFNLPDWFVATYSVKATGASGTVATTSFLDSNVQVGANLSTGESTKVVWQRYNSTDCSGTALTGANNTGTFTLNGSATSPIPSGATSGSIKLTADVQTTTTPQKAFNNWEASGSATSANMSAVSGSGVNVTCTSGFNGGSNTHIYTANYGNTAPSTPGTPSTSSNPNKGIFTLSWTASTDAEGNPITYRLEHKSASDTSYSLVTGAGNLSTNSFSFTSAAQEDEGTWTYRVQASDTSAAGNLSSAFSATSAAIKVDKTAPETTINSKPANPSNNANPSFSFSSNETGSTFQCSLDNGSFSNCTSPQNLDKLSDGSHTFQVRATDAAGNVEATPASYTWTVDRTAPNAPVISSPANNSSVGASFTLSGTAEANSTVELFESTTSKGTTQANASGNWSITLNNVSGGSHSYTAKATDAAGNTSVASSTRTVIVDATAPTATITSGPAAGSTVNSASASFSFSSNETGSTFQCSLDGAAYTTCSSPQNYTNLSDGSHTFSVKATDAAGNTGTPASRTWTVSTDSVAPTTTASAKNADNSTYNSGDWTKQNVTVSLSATDGGSGVKEITYSASGAQTIAQNTQAGNSVTLPAITAEGTTTVTYKATDNNGNVEANNTFTVKIDKTAPVISGADVNDTTWRNTDRSASFTASDPGSGLANSADASFTLTASQESANATTPTTVSKTVTDAAGNSATRTLSAKIDKTAPSVTVGSATTQPNAAGWYKSDVTNNFSASDGLSGLADASQASFQKSSSTEGSAVTISSGTVADKAGNVSDDIQSPDFKIDKTAPVISGADVNDTTWRNTDRSADFTSSDALSGLSAAADASFTLTASAESQGASAPTTVSKTVTDQAGNSSTRSLSALIDKTKPVITDQGPTPATPDGQNGWYVHPVTNNFSASDGLSGFAGQSDPYTISKSSGTNEGTAVKIASGSVTDKAGNTAASIDSAAFKIDTKAPAAPSALDLLASSDTGSSDTDNTTQDTTPTFSVKAEAGSTVKLYKGTDNTPIGSAVADASGVAEVTTNVLADGTYTIDATATDDAGNVSALSSTIQVTIDVTVDTAAPLAPTGLDMAAASDTGSSNSDDITSDASPVISGNAEKGSDVKLYDGTNVVGSAKANATTGDWSITTSVLAEGDRTLTAKATDTAGNTSVASGALKVTVDKSAPVIKNDGADATFSTPNAAGWYKTDVRNKFSATDNVALADATQASFTKTSSTEGSAVKIASGSVTDKAGNTAASIDSVSFKIDKTAPSISDDGPTTQPNVAGWYKSDVTNNFSATDGVSGLADSTQASFQKTTQGEGTAVKVVSGSVSDVAGNVAPSIDSASFKVDKSNPVIVATGTVNGTAGTNGWYTSAISVEFKATDGLSGFAGGKADPYTFTQSSGTQEGDAVAVNSGSVSDLAGNAADTVNSGPFKVDYTKPVLNPVVSPNPVLLNGTATASHNASDATSGIASANCGSVITSSVGAKSVLCSATDNAGNQNSANAQYNVNYNFAGYRQPVDNNGVYNTAKAGSAIPMKFSLFGNQGMNIFSTVVTPNPKVTKVVCEAGASMDAIEELATTNSGLTYDATADQYNYVWKTQSAYAGSCYKFDMVLMDGTHHAAFFKFTR